MTYISCVAIVSGVQHGSRDKFQFFISNYVKYLQLMINQNENSNEFTECTLGSKEELSRKSL
jgi:hypothetical protein